MIQTCKLLALRYACGPRSMNITRPDGTVLSFRSVDDCVKYQAALNLRDGATSQEGAPTPSLKREKEESCKEDRRHGITKAVPTPLAHESKPKGGRKMESAPCRFRSPVHERSRSRDRIHRDASKHDRRNLSRPDSDRSDRSARRNVRSSSHNRRDGREHSSAPEEDTSHSNAHKRDHRDLSRPDSDHSDRNARRNVRSHSHSRRDGREHSNAHGEDTSHSNAREHDCRSHSRQDIDLSNRGARRDVRSHSHGRNDCKEHSSAPEEGTSSLDRSDLNAKDSRRERSRSGRPRNALRMSAALGEVSGSAIQNAKQWTPTWTTRPDRPRDMVPDSARFRSIGYSAHDGSSSLSRESTARERSQRRDRARAQDKARSDIHGYERRSLSKHDHGGASIDATHKVRERDGGHKSKDARDVHRQAQRAETNRSDQAADIYESHTRGRDGSRQDKGPHSGSREVQREKQDRNGHGVDKDRSSLRPGVRERSWTAQAEGTRTAHRDAQHGSQGSRTSGASRTPAASARRDKREVPRDEGKRGWRVAMHQQKARTSAASSENERGDFYSGVAKHVTDSSARQPAQLKATAVTLKPRGDMIDPEEQRKRDLRAQRFREVREAKNFATGEVWIVGEALGASEVSKAEEALRAVGVSSSVAPQSARLLPASHRKRLAELGSLCWSVIRSLYAYLSGIDIAREGVDRRAILKHGPARKAALAAEKDRHVQALIAAGAIADDFDGDPFAAFNAHVRDCARIANCEGSITANPSEIFLAIEDTPADKEHNSTAADSIAEIEIGEAHPIDCTCDECI